MSTKELLSYISPFVLLAFIINIISEFCPPSISLNNSPFFRSAQDKFNVSCYVKSFSPEAPEISLPYSQTTSTPNSLATISSSSIATGASVGTTTTL